MAQVMNYYKYPECGTGSYSYYTDTKHIYQSMDFSTVRPDWGNMLDTYRYFWEDEGDTDAQKAAVAQLMHACGVSVQMNYTAEASGAGTYDLAYALSHFWKYSKSISYKTKQYYSDAEWKEIIQQDLLAGHPILYGGNDGEDAGHQFILDGCDDNGLYHFNFGWGGFCDGYYSLDLINPANDFYSSNQNMICFVTPETTGPAEAEFYTDNALSLTEIAIGSQQSVSFNITNQTAWTSYFYKDSPLFSGMLGVGVFDKDFRFVKSLGEFAVSFRGCMSYSGSFYLKFDESTFKNGSQYYVAFYAYSDETGYSIVRTEHGQNDYLLATVQGGKITFEPMKPTEPVVTEVAAPLISVSSDHVMTLNCDTEQAVILYTLDDSHPYPFGTRYTQPVELTTNANIQAIAIKDGHLSSVSTYKVSDFTCLEPEITRPEENNIIALTCGTPDAVIYYTVDGTDPDENAYRYLDRFLIFKDCTVKAVARKQGYNDSPVASLRATALTCLEPEISSVDVHNVVTITCGTPDAMILYTLDGSDPFEKGWLYVRSIKITEDCTVKAVAYKHGYNDSPVVSKDIVSHKAGEAEVRVLDNKAGELESRVTELEKNYAGKWYISGELNGTDIRFLKEVFQLGNITDLDLTDATIVSGGDPCVATPEEYYTEDKVIGKDMFISARSLVSLALPSNTIRVEDYAVCFCHNLLSIVIPDACEKLTATAIYQCDRLTSIHLGKSVSEYSGYCGSYCPALTSITVSPGNTHFTSVDGVLFNAEQTTLVKYPAGKGETEYTVPSTVRSIGYESFCSAAVTRVNLPKELTNISSGAFEKCDIDSIHIPAGIRSISIYAFRNCKNLGVVECAVKDISSVDLPLSEKYPPFEGIPADCFWHVPSGCADAYRAQPWWVPTWRIADDCTTGVRQAPQGRNLVISIENGSLIMRADAKMAVTVYDIRGMVIKTLSLMPGESRSVALPAGTYIVNGHKYHLKNL